MRRRTAAGAVAVALALLGGPGLTGCGVRATTVPVDAGAAPSRLSCALPTSVPTPGPTTPPGGATTAQVYLVCAQRVSPIERTLRAPLSPTDPLGTARILLATLEAKPDAAEVSGGFATEVPGGLTVDGPATGDPAGALRLSQDPADLPSFATAQIVCTFAGTAAGVPGTSPSVLLGGPDPTLPPRRYWCDDALRTNPDAGTTAGTSVTGTAATPTPS